MRLVQPALFGLALVGLAAQSAIAQDLGGKPTFGTVDLDSGFTPDPYTVELQSGGGLDASDLSSECSGFIASAPDVRLVYGDAGILPLIIAVDSDTDTTLVVNAPNGSWYCDDDSGGLLNPMMRFDDPQSGRYEIWVGTFGGDGLHDATLKISELDSTITDAADNGPSVDLSAAPSFGTIDLETGFTPDPHVVKLRSGGSVAASGIADGCGGYVAQAPDVRVNYSGGSLPLILSVEAGSDTTLVVNDPNGNWICDDDSGDGLNPSVRFAKPLSGQYDVWVGTYSDGSFQDAALSISELSSE